MCVFVYSNRVEGKIFYGHKIVLVTASPRFQSMLSSKLSEGNTPTVQINDIRYHIFQVSVMHFHVFSPHHLIFNEAITIKLKYSAHFVFFFVFIFPNLIFLSFFCHSLSLSSQYVLLLMGFSFPNKIVVGHAIFI